MSRFFYSYIGHHNFNSLYIGSAQGIAPLSFLRRDLGCPSVVEGNLGFHREQIADRQICSIHEEA